MHSPKTAGLVSFFIVTIAMCLVTYFIVFNLQHLKDAVTFGRSTLHSWKPTDSRKGVQRRRAKNFDEHQTPTKARFDQP